MGPPSKKKEATAQGGALGFFMALLFLLVATFILAYLVISGRAQKLTDACPYGDIRYQHDTAIEEGQRAPIYPLGHVAVK